MLNNQTTRQGGKCTTNFRKMRYLTLKAEAEGKDLMSQGQGYNSN